MTGPESAEGGGEEALQAFRALDAWGWERDWAGSDPYDGLNTVRLLTPLKRHRRGRQALMQLVKRTPVDLRPLLGIRGARDSAALAWIISSYCAADFLEPAERDRRIDILLGWLMDERSPGWEDTCFGYHYDMQSRVFFYPTGDPNVIATCFAGYALLDLHDRGWGGDLLEHVHGIGRFLMRNVPQTPDAPGAFFGYLVGDRSPIHNSNLHVCAYLARAADVVDEPKWKEAAADGVTWTVSRQRPEGQFPYGERPNLSWVDGFHTGYVLDALQVCAAAGIEQATPEVWQRALDYYERRLFDADGAARYYDDNRWPIDMQCVAQALQTFSRASRVDRRYLDPARRVLAYARRCMLRDDGAYNFQRRRAWVNRAPHIRGANADMMLGLGLLVGASSAP
jgi:hypothetical protein